MPVGEIAGELLGGLFRFLGHVIVDVIFELLIKGVGYGICRMFSKNVNPDGAVVIMTGIGFWMVAGIISFVMYTGIF